MNKKEVAAKVVEHLMTQKEKSVAWDNSTRCLYRGPNGTKCAVGCLIEDEFYTPSMENQIVGASIINSALRKSGVPCSIEIEQLLRDLQDLHDYEFYKIDDDARKAQLLRDVLGKHGVQLAVLT